MQSTIVVVEPAESIDLITLDEFKRALNITTTTQDQMLSELITRVSAEIAAYCNNRVFGAETVIETFTEIPPPQNRLFLARFPVKTPDDILSIDNAGAAVDPANDCLLDALWGKLTLRNGATFVEESVISYRGGYNLPDEAPPALKQAATILMREAYYASLRGDQSVRMLAHKESRIIYFDPNTLAKAATSGSGVSGGGTAAQRAVHDLLSHFTRYEV
jgi:Phage gp6-like head-tail connector protein